MNDLYDPANPLADPDAIGAVYVPETGEILISDAAFDLLKSNITDPLTTEIRVTYEKDKWLERDLRPEHYFACVATERDLATGIDKPPINYNLEYLDGKSNGQIITYDVGYNQRIQINTLAEDVFKHAMDRNVDDLDIAVRQLLDIETTLKDLKAIRDSFGEGTAEFLQVQKQVDAAQKAYDYIRENVHKMFEHSITVMQEALNAINVAVTDSGTRSARLDLISNRLLSQKTTFEVLKSENEDVDIAEVAIKLTSTELSYNAALMATGKIMQTSLMNYI
jgi:flagellar hook-associated protein 3 FlgL